MKGHTQYGDQYERACVTGADAAETVWLQATYRSSSIIEQFRVAAVVPILYLFYSRLRLG